MASMELLQELLLTKVWRSLEAKLCHGHNYSNSNGKKTNCQSCGGLWARFKVISLPTKFVSALSQSMELFHHFDSTILNRGNCLLIVPGNCDAKAPGPSKRDYNAPGVIHLSRGQISDSIEAPRDVKSPSGNCSAMHCTLRAHGRLCEPLVPLIGLRVQYLHGYSTQNYPRNLEPRNRFLWQKLYHILAANCFLLAADFLIPQLKPTI